VLRELGRLREIALRVVVLNSVAKLIVDSCTVLARNGRGLATLPPCIG